MNKQEFLNKLKSKLEGLPKKEINEQISFYSEMIDDRVEEGLSEENAISQIGSVNDIAKQIIEQTEKASENPKKKGKLTWWEITLLALGSPMWISLIVSAFAVVISLYVSLWSVVISLWAAELSFSVGAVAGILGGTVYAFINASLGFILIGAGILLGGLSIFTFYGCKYVTKFSSYLTIKITKLIKNSFIRKEKI